MNVDLICFPRDDEVFAERVRAMCDRFPNALPQSIQQLLQVDFPAVRVAQRDELAEMGRAQRPTWYAFRYGSAVA